MTPLTLRRHVTGMHPQSRPHMQMERKRKKRQTDDRNRGVGGWVWSKGAGALAVMFDFFFLIKSFCIPHLIKNKYNFLQKEKKIKPSRIFPNR